jgi:hypothetical protein
MKQLADLLGMTEEEFKRQILHPTPAPSDLHTPGHDSDEEVPF